MDSEITRLRASRSVFITLNSPISVGHKEFARAPTYSYKSKISMGRVDYCSTPNLQFKISVDHINYFLEDEFMNGLVIVLSLKPYKKDFSD